MATTQFDTGAIAKIDKNNRTHGTKNGQWLVIVKTSNGDKKAEVHIFNDEGDAKATQAHVKGTGAGVGALPKPVKVLNNATKTIVGNVTSNVDNVMKVVGVAPSPYDGKTVKGVTLPIMVGGIFQGTTVTDAKIEHSGSSFAFVFSHGGNVIKVPASEDDIKLKLGMTPVATYAVKMTEAICGKALIQALKLCPGSKSISAADEVCAKELEQLLVAAGIVQQGLLDFADPNERAQLAAMAAAVKTKAEAATAITASTPQAIGAHLAAVGGSGGGVGGSNGNGNNGNGAAADKWRTELDGAPVPEQLKVLAALAKTEQDFRDMLTASVDITIDKAKHAQWAATSVKAQMGALERLLRNVKNKIDLTGIGSKGAMTCDALKNELINIKMVADGDDDDEATAAASSSDRRRETKMGGSIWNEHNGEPKSGVSETQRRERQVLRSDMEKLAESTDGMETLEELNELRENGDANLLIKKVSELEDEPLKRLIHSSGDVSMALQGMRDPRPLDMVVNLRSALERRIERSLFGDKEAPSERVTTAIKNIRLGNLAQLKLLHVLDKDDCGSEEDPLKQMKNMNETEALASLNEALQRICAIVQLAHPASSMSAILFFNKLVKRIGRLKSRGASWPALSEWLSSIFRLVARPQRSYSFGERKSGGLLLDAELITQTSEYNEKLEDRIRMKDQVSINPNAKKRELGSDTKDDEPPLSRSQRQRQRKKAKTHNDTAAPAKAAATAAAAEEEDDSPPAGMMPAKGSKERKEWNNANKINGKPRCWYDGNGGCSRGESCPFPHKK